MAWSFIDSTSHGEISTATDFVVTLPTNSSGDVAIITAYKDQDLGDWSIATSGWVLLTTDRGSSGRDRSQAIFYKVVGSSESDPTITYSHNQNEEMTWTCHVFRTSIGSLSTVNVIDDWGRLANTNGQSPPAAPVATSEPGDMIFAVNMETHGDIVSVTGLTGFTLGETLYTNTYDNAQQLVAYDLDAGVAGVKDLGDWIWTNNGTALSEYTTYTIALIFDPAIKVETQPLFINTGDTNITITGYGFEGTQGTGKVELGDSPVYASATKVTQSIDSWSDTSIQFDAVTTGMPSNGFLYIFVTNDSGDISGGAVSYIGNKPYYDEVLTMANAPDIYCRLNNDYTDENGTYPFGNLTTGSVGFQAIPLANDSTHSWAANDAGSRTEMVNNYLTNITSTHSERLIAMRIQLPEVFLAPTGIWEEGGGVNNIYFITGFGNTLLANIADSNASPAFKVQTFSDFKLTVGRTYHIAVKFIGATEFSMFIDGVKMAVVTGDLGTDTTMSTHSGGLSIGKPDSTLDTGGTDIQYPSGTDLLIADWMTFSGGNSGLPADSVIRETLFELGAIATDEIDVDTEANMQIDIDALADTAYVDKPLPLKINKVTGNGSFALDFDNITFDDRCSMHVQFLGTAGETLTIINSNGSNTTLADCSTPYGGTIVIVNPYSVTIAGAKTGSNIQIYDSSNDNLLGTTASSSGDYILTVEAANIDIHIIHDDYKIVQKLDVSITSDSYIPVVQEDDYVYHNA